MIQGETYRQKVTPPSASSLVNLSPQELTQILAKKMSSSQPLTREKSIFQAYVSRVSSFNEINDLYKHMKLIQPTARHIVCAFYIDGDQHHYTRDYHDDEEPGAGRNLLNILKKYGLNNCVVFVTRKFGGVKMGPERFVCYQNVALEALEKEMGPLVESQDYKNNQQLSKDPQLPKKPQM